MQADPGRTSFLAENTNSRSRMFRYLQLATEKGSKKQESRALN